MVQATPRGVALTPDADEPRVEAGGASLPALGFGTWELTGRTARRMAETALELGYRHIDTAEAYRNEKAVGRALEASEIPRGEVFLTTKVWPDHFGPDAFRPAVRRSLERLRVERADLLLLHWPAFGDATLEGTVARLAEAREEGLTRHIGVSNFTVAQLERARAAAGGVPVVTDQVEYHPYLDQTALLAACRRHGVALTAYCPLARGRVAGDATLRAITRRHDATAAQVALAWLLAQGAVAIPRTSDPDHCAENRGALGVRLSDEEVAEVSRLARPDGRLIDPEGLAPAWD